jgi:hypothetical protein
MRGPLIPINRRGPAGHNPAYVGRVLWTRRSQSFGPAVHNREPGPKDPAYYRDPAYALRRSGRAMVRPRH